MEITFGPSVGALVRWIHIAIGMLWVGGLVWFTFAGARAVKDHGQERRKAAGLPSRALSLFRWGAAATWTTGMLLTVVVYYALDQLVRREVRLETRYGMTVDFIRATDEPVVSHPAGLAISLAAIGISFLAYEAIWKALRAHPRIAASASYALFVAALYLLSRFFTGRAVFMHAGALLGGAMAMDVRARADLAPSEVIRRREHAAYMALPAVLAMLATHDAAIYDRQNGWVVMALVVAASWAAMAWALRRVRERGAGAMMPAPSS